VAKPTKDDPPCLESDKGGARAAHEPAELKS
jgi:hypothetical protein